MIRRFGEPMVTGQAYRRRPGAYAVLSNGRDVLLTLQAGDAPEFQLPGGGVDPGETALQALHREVYEETGWAISQPRKLGVFRRFAYMPEYGLWAEKLCHIYIARPTLRKGPPLEAGHSAHWVTPLMAVACLHNDGDRYFLSQALLG